MNSQTKFESKEKVREKFSVVIVGRPNVGKSSLFNRVAKRRVAIVHEVAGTTRDLITTEISCGEKSFELTDTAGYLHDKNNFIVEEALQKAEEAIKTADLVWLVVDGMVAPTASDQRILEIIRKSGKKTFLVVNKIDNPKKITYLTDYQRFGLKELFITSVIHNRGVGELISETANFSNTKNVEEEDKQRVPKVTLIGRPNVGKSSIFNQIVSENKSIVADIPGTTRDVVCDTVLYNEKRITICDTGGARKPGKIGKAYKAGEPVEKYAYLRTETEIENSDIILVVLDAQDGLAAQDLHLAGKAKEAGKGIILVINKWDMVEDVTQEDFLKGLRKSFGFMIWVPVIFVSAKTGKNIKEILPQIEIVMRNRLVELPTAKLNRILEDYALFNRPKGVKNIFPKVYFITQIGTNPPSFQIAAKNHAFVHFSWKRAFENELRRHFDFTGTPIKIEFKANRNK